MILQITYGELINPPELTMGLAIILAVIFLSTLWAGFRLNHSSIIFMFMLQMFAFIFTIITELQFMWFWLIVILSAMVISMIAVAKQVL